MASYIQSNLRHIKRGNIEKEQRALVDKERQEWTPPSLNLPDTRYIQIQPQDIELALSFMRKDSINQLAQRTNLNSLLAGGATAIVGDIEVEPSWCRKTITQCYESLTALGWASFTWVPDRHAEGGRQGKMIDPQQFDVWFRQNALSEPDCIYVTRPGTAASDFQFFAPTFQNSRFGGQVLANVWHVFVAPPDHYGNLQSRLVGPLMETLLLDAERSLDLIAAKGRAEPIFVTEFKERKQQSLEASLGLNNDRSALAAQMQRSADHLKRFEKLQTLLGKTEASMGSDTYRSVLMAMTEMQNRSKNIMGRNVVELEDERTHVSSQLPEGPEAIMEKRIVLQQEKLMAQDVPPALVQAESSRSSRIGVDQSAIGVFEKSQLCMRSHYTEILEFITGTIYGPAAVIKMLSGVPLNRPLPNPDTISKAVKPKVSIPGQPAPEVMHQLYQTGILTYEALCRHISGIYTIPMSDLNKEPAIPLQDLVTQGKMSLEKTKGETAKVTNESKERQLQLQVKKQELSNAKPKAKAKSKSKAKKKS